MAINTPTPADGALPGWLKPANRLVLALQRLGMRSGTTHVLTVQGRRSGSPHSTPLSVLTVDHTRYLVGGSTDMQWVQNVRAAG
jgi:hypothetical protein